VESAPLPFPIDDHADVLLVKIRSKHRFSTCVAVLARGGIPCSLSQPAAL